MPWYMYFAISGALLGVALAMSLTQYLLTRDKGGLKCTATAALVVACILLCSSVVIIVALYCGGGML